MTRVLIIILSSVVGTTVKACVPSGKFSLKSTPDWRDKRQKSTCIRLDEWRGDVKRLGLFDDDDKNNKGR